MARVNSKKLIFHWFYRWNRALKKADRQVATMLAGLERRYLGSYLGPCGAAGRFRGILGTHRGKSRYEMIIRGVAR